MAARSQSTQPQARTGERPLSRGADTQPSDADTQPSDARPQPPDGQGQVARPGEQPLILARGPWPLERVTASWRAEQYEPSRADSEAADAAIEELRERGSPSHDGVAARLVGYRHDPGEGLTLELQPQRWALRLIAGEASDSVAALCVTRSADGRWLAGRRAPWVASWAGRWALGAGGAVDLEENPADTLVRELREEWSVTPARVRGEALVRLPHRLVMFIGQAWLAEGADAEVTPDDEHDAFEWWPREIGEWPAVAEAPLRLMARWLEAE